MHRAFGIFLIIVMFLGGCSASKKNIKNIETREDIKTAIGSVAEALSGQELTKEELNALSDQILKDPETQSALESIADSFHGKRISVKYCPLDGQRFSPKVEQCPDHGVDLRWVDE